MIGFGPRERWVSGIYARGREHAWIEPVYRRVSEFPKSTPARTRYDFAAVVVDAEVVLVSWLVEAEELVKILVRYDDPESAWPPPWGARGAGSREQAERRARQVMVRGRGIA